MTDRMPIVVSSPDELLAAVPHLLGFQPQESLVLVPFDAKLPVVRADIPRTAEDRDALWNEQLRDPMTRNAGPGGARVAVLGLTEDRQCAQLASQHLARGLESVGIQAPIRLWSDGSRWEDLTTGDSGVITAAATERVAATAVYAGHAQPATSREAMAAAMVGDRAPVAARLGEAFPVAESSTPTAEGEWALDRLQRFQADGIGLSDPDAARLLVAAQTISTRDALWEDMTRDSSASHLALWTDLTRRAPDEVRAPAASLAAFAGWLGGDGAKAWCALDQVPPGQAYAMAAVVASAVQTGLHPDQWESTASEVRTLATQIDQGIEQGIDQGIDESFVPLSPTRSQHHRDPTPGQHPGRPGPSTGR